MATRQALVLKNDDPLNITHDVIPSGDTLDVSVVPLSAAAGNTLVVNGAGLYVPTVEIPEVNIADYVSETANNQITVVDEKLYVAPTEIPEVNPADLVSDAEGNQLTVNDDKLFVAPYVLDIGSLINLNSLEAPNYIIRDADGKLLVDGNSVLSNEAGNQLGISAVDGKIYSAGSAFDPTQWVSTNCPGNILTADATGFCVQPYEFDPSQWVSEDEGNDLTIGEDGKFLVRSYYEMPVVLRAEQGWTADTVIPPNAVTATIISLDTNGTFTNESFVLQQLTGGASPTQISIPWNEETPVPVNVAELASLTTAVTWSAPSTTALSIIGITIRFTFEE